MPSLGGEREQRVLWRHAVEQGSEFSEDGSGVWLPNHRQLGGQVTGVILQRRFRRHGTNDGCVIFGR